MKTNLQSYEKDFAELLNLIHLTKQRTFAKINKELIELYWQLGKKLSDKVAANNWGKGVVKELAKYISQNASELKGFSDKNLWRMKQFYDTYHSNPKLSPLVREIPWTHNTIIFSRCKTDEERAYYLCKCSKEGYSSRELERQISSSQFERSETGKPILSAALRELYPHIGNNFKDRYVLEFLGLPPKHSEQGLQKALLKNMKQFILELGSDFIFIGEEYRLQVGKQDFFVDLLFFHRGLSALVAFELKVDKFKPEHIGQLNFYLEALDRDVKKQHENPTIGVLLCRDKDDEVVEYALSRNMSPALIAEYETKLPDKKLLRSKLREIIEDNSE